MKTYVFVDQTIRGAVVCTRFESTIAAERYAAIVGGTVRAPKEVRQSEFASALWHALRG